MPRQSFCWVPRQVGIVGNEKATAAAAAKEAAINENNPTSDRAILVPHKDIKRHIREDTMRE